MAEQKNGHLNSERLNRIVAEQENDVQVSPSISPSPFLYIKFGFEIMLIVFHTLYYFIRFILSRLIPRSFKSVKGEIILITGGANGIGREICLQLAQLETSLTIISWDVDENANELLVKELKSMGVDRAYGFKVDVSDRLQVEETAKKIRQDIGNVTMLFNNAGINGPVDRAWEADPVGIQRVFDVNIISHCWTLREFLPSMIRKGKGHVVETCSAFGFYWGRNDSPYMASKHALRGYIEAVKEDLRHLENKPKIKFTLIYPNNTMTAMTANINFRSGKYPFLVPQQTPQFVASEIICGVLRNEEHVYVPGNLRLFAMILQFLPPPVVRRIADMVDMQTNSH